MALWKKPTPNPDGGHPVIESTSQPRDVDGALWEVASVEEHAAYQAFLAEQELALNPTERFDPPAGFTDLQAHVYRRLVDLLGIEGARAVAALLAPDLSAHVHKATGTLTGPPLPGA